MHGACQGMDCCNSETFAGPAGAAEIGAELAASDVAGDVVGVLVEGQQVDLAGFDPAHDLLDSVEAEAFEAQMQPGTGAEPGPGRSQRREELPRRLDAAQAGLPGQRHAVIRRGDAIGQQLPIRLKQRRHRREMHPRPRHELALEGVAMKIDDARQHEIAAGIGRHSGLLGRDRDNSAIRDRDAAGPDAAVSVQQASAGQDELKSNSSVCLPGVSASAPSQRTRCRSRKLYTNTGFQTHACRIANATWCSAGNAYDPSDGADWRGSSQALKPGAGKLVTKRMTFR